MRIADLVTVLATCAGCSDGSHLLDPGNRAQLVVETPYSSDAEVPAPRFAVLGRGRDARAEPLDADGRAVFEAPGEPPYTVTIALGDRWLHTIEGAADPVVSFPRDPPAVVRYHFRSPALIRATVSGAGDDVSFCVLDGDTEIYVPGRREPDGRYTLPVSDASSRAPLRVIAVAREERRPIAYGSAYLSEVIEEGGEYELEIELDEPVDRPFDLDVRGTDPFLLGASLSVGLGFSDVLDCAALRTDPPLDYRAAVDLPGASLERSLDDAFTVVDLGPLPYVGGLANRRQSARLFLSGDVPQVVAVELLPVPEILTRIGTGSAPVRHDLDGFELEVELPERATAVLHLSNSACDRFSWRIELPEGTTSFRPFELPEVVPNVGLSLGVPIHVQLDAERREADRILRSSATGSIELIGAPRCAEALPEWATGLFETSPEIACGTFATRFTIDACGLMSWQIPDWELTSSGCGAVARETEDAIGYASESGSSGFHELGSGTWTRGELADRYVRVSGVEPAIVPPSLAGFYGAASIDDRVLGDAPELPVYGSWHFMTENIGAWIDHRGRYRDVWGEEVASREGVITAWNGRAGTITFLSNEGLCMSEGGAAELLMLDESRFEITTRLGVSDIEDLDADGLTDEVLRVERKMIIERR